MHVLNEHLDQWHLLKHPFYIAWSKGELTQEDLKTYACQYYHQVNAFPRYVSATHSNGVSLQDRQVLLQNLIEEEHGSQNHPALWLKFAKGLGVDESTVKSSEPCKEVNELIKTFLSTCQSSYAEGLGALYAYERQVPAVAESKICGLEQHFGITDPEAIKFFKVHMHSDVEHTQDVENLISKLSEPEQKKAHAAAASIAKAVWDALTGIYNQTIGLRMAATV
ncbi:MAG: CADD family putative folate metabolism protein [Gammaproteobacteria bacterium]|nr:CADD family putative folate metabolism protein [Gammaproteobacteria bacterium]